MFPLFPSLLLLTLTALALIRDRRVRRGLFATLTAALEFGYALLRAYAFGIAVDAGTVTNAGAPLIFAELAISTLLLGFVSLRALRWELAN